MGNNQCCKQKKEIPDTSWIPEATPATVPAFEVAMPEVPMAVPESAVFEPEAATADGVGDHICAVTGVKEADEFNQQDVLSKLLAASGEELGRTFSLAPDALASTQKKSVGGIACAVSDPAAEDCPLVYVSAGFQDLTGYTTEFTTGRNCRFLQPISKTINDAFNLDDRKEMRSFCIDPQPNGKVIVNLLVNENAVTGERFWNLLRMQYIGIEARQYIFGVQTTIDAYMPKAMVKRLKVQENNNKLVEAMEEFRSQLTRIRAELRKMTHAPIFEVKGYFTAMLNHIPMVMKLSPGMNKQISKQVSSAQEAPAEEEAFVEGVKVELVADVKYASGALSKGEQGVLKSVDSFGNVAVAFASGTRGILKRDLKKLKKIS
jgi:hypothetical protein